MKIILSVLIALIFTGSIFAQSGNSMRKGENIDKLKAELDLSESQVSQLEALNASHREEMKNLKSAIDLTTDQRKAKFLEMRETNQQQIDAILTSEQQEKVATLKKDRMADQAVKKMERRKKVKGDKAELKELRTKFDRQIAEEDRTELSRIRIALKEDRMAQGVKREKDSRKAFREEHKDDFKKLKELADKYKTEVASFMDENGMEKKARKEIKEKRKGKMKSDDKKQNAQKRKVKGKRKGQRKGKNKVSQFLLIDPDTQRIQSAQETGSISIYPNPSANFTTVKYQVLQSGTVRIELKDESGNLVKTLENKNLEKGEHQLEISTSDLSNRNYYIVVTDQAGVATKQLINIKN